MEVRGRQEFEPKAGTDQMGGVQPTCSRPAVADCPSAPGGNWRRHVSPKQVAFPTCRHSDSLRRSHHYRGDHRDTHNDDTDPLTKQGILIFNHADQNAVIQQGEKELQQVALLLEEKGHA